MARFRSFRKHHRSRAGVLILALAALVAVAPQTRAQTLRQGFGMLVRYNAGVVTFSWDSAGVRASNWLTPSLDSLVNKVLMVRIRDSANAWFTVGPRLLTPALVAPAGTNGWVLTTSGGIATWAPAAGSVDTLRLWPVGNSKVYWGSILLNGDVNFVGKGRLAAPDSSTKDAIVNKTLLDSMIIRELVFGREFTVTDTSSAKAFGPGGAAGVPVAAEGLIVGVSWSISDASGATQDANYKRTSATSSYTQVGIRGSHFLIRVLYKASAPGGLARRFVVETKGMTGGSWTERISIDVHAFDLTDPSFSGYSSVSVHLRRRYYNDSYL